MHSPLVKLASIVGLALFVAIAIAGMAYHSQAVSRRMARAALPPRLSDEELIKRVEDVPEGSEMMSGGSSGMIKIPGGDWMPISEFRQIQATARAVNHTQPRPLTPAEWKRYLSLTHSDSSGPMGYTIPPNAKRIPEPGGLEGYTTVSN